MKRRKINRKRRFYRRRSFHFPWKIVGSIVLLAALVVGGIFAAKGIHNLSMKKPSPITPGEVSTTESVKTNTTAVPTQTTKAPEAVVSIENCKSFYMTTSTLLNKEKREAQINEAAKAGLTGVVFDLKDSKGIINYATTYKKASEIKAIADTVLSVDELKSFLSFCKGKNITCIPRLFCFEDRTAAAGIASARVLLNDGSKYMWLDNSSKKGGKPWLNPYSPDAHKYLQTYIKELSDFGFEGIILDSVQFPNQTYAASFGSTSLSSMSKLGVLSKFVKDSQKIAGKCKILVASTGSSLYSESTEIYGGNPLNFGSSIVAPMEFPSSLGSVIKSGTEKFQNDYNQPGKALAFVLKQTGIRIQLMDKNTRPTILPFIQAYAYTKEQIAAEIKSVRDTVAKDAGFILFNSDGIYDFDSYAI